MFQQQAQESALNLFEMAHKTVGDDELRGLHEEAQT